MQTLNLKDYIGETLDDPGDGDDFLDITPNMWSMEEINGKLELTL